MSSSTKGKQLALFVILLLFAWTATNWYHTVEAILRYYTPLPVWDYWRVVEQFEGYRGLDLRVFWKQHNEHRIVFPELVFAADMLLLRGRQFLPLAVSFGCYVGIWVISAFTLFADEGLSSIIRWVIVLLSGVVIGWQGSAQVVGVPFQLQWTLTQFAVVLALYLITRFKESSKPIYLAGAVMCAIVANYSSANGLCFWSILLLSGLILSLKRRHLVILSVAAVVSISLFFVGYRVSGSLNLRNIVTHPGYFVEFVSAYLSMPFLAIGNPRASLWIGFVSLGAFFILSGLAARNRLLASKPAIVFLGYYAFTLLTAVLTAAGRMDPADPYFSSAIAARYVTVPLVNWAVLIAAAIWFCWHRGWKVVSWGIAATAATLLWIAFPKLTPWLTENSKPIAEQHWAAISVENGIFDPVLIRKINPFPSLAKTDLGVLRKYRLSIYSRAYSRWLGEPAVSRFTLPDGSPQAGQVTQVFPVESGLEVIGWADRVHTASYSPQIVFLNQAGRIVGFGRRPAMGLPPYLASLETPASIAWIGFINLKLSPEGEFFSIYAIDRRGKNLFPISGTVSPPVVQPVDAEDIGPPIPNLRWQMDSSWTTNSLPPQVNPSLDAPPSARFFSSWSGSDQNTGRIVSSPIDVSTNGACIVLPVLHGPSIGGLSVRIAGTETNKILAEIPMQGNDLGWRIWRVPVNAATKQFRITAEDEGRDWGQWVAIGEPRYCH